MLANQDTLEALNFRYVIFVAQTVLLATEHLQFHAQAAEKISLNL